MGAVSNVATISADGIVVNQPGPTGSRLIEQTVAAHLSKPVAPLGDRASIDTKADGKLGIGTTLGRSQHNLGPQRQTGRTGWPSRPSLQLGALIVAQHDLCCHRAPSRHTPSYQPMAN